MSLTTAFSLAISRNDTLASKHATIVLPTSLSQLQDLEYGKI